LEEIESADSLFGFAVVIISPSNWPFYQFLEAQSPATFILANK
jgi:hypothetical protein